ncbi:MAG: helix-turn-helix domain-containing protein [Alkalispirochaeta sp.]
MSLDNTNTTGVLNLSEAAAFVRVSEKTLREMARDKKVPARKVGREWRFLRQRLEEWLNQAPGNGYVAESDDEYGQQLLIQREKEKNGKIKFGDTAFSKNRREPLHRWVPWIAGFSAAFVEDVFGVTVAHQDPRDVTVLDPFAGVGTTLVEGLKRGYNVIGFDINPYAILATNIKMRAIDANTDILVQVIRQIEQLETNPPDPDTDPVSLAPAGFRSKRSFFSPNVERQVLFIKDVINQQNDAYIKDVLRTALGSVMVSFSNYSYEPSLGTRIGAGKEEIQNAEVYRIFADKLWEIEADIGFLQKHMQKFDHVPSRKVVEESFLTGYSNIAPGTIDVLITSPPYLNNYHYIRNTRPQLYWLDLVQESQALKKVEQDNFGLYWQTVRSGPEISLMFRSPEIEQIIAEIRSRNNQKGTYGGQGWANYAATYFNDTYSFFQATARVMRPGGRVVIVIGNNIVQGVHIETDRLLAEIGEMQGFELVQMHTVRKKRTGSSIVNSSVRVGNNKRRVQLHETAVELKAPG